MAERNRLQGLLHHKVPDGITLALTVPTLADGLPSARVTQARALLAQATANRSETENLAVPTEMTKDEVLAQLRTWINRWLISGSALSLELGRATSYVSNVFMGKQPLEQGPKLKLIDLITSPELPPRQLIAVHPKAEHYGLTLAELRDRQEEIHRAYTQATAPTPSLVEEEPVPAHTIAPLKAQSQGFTALCVDLDDTLAQLDGFTPDELEALLKRLDQHAVRIRTQVTRAKLLTQFPNAAPHKLDAALRLLLEED